MNGINVITSDLARCLTILKETGTPLTAAEIASRLYLPGCRETQRRHVRAIIEQLRKSGAKIIATLSEGYWLTNDLALWRDYLEGRQIDAKIILAETYKRKRMLADAAGQGILFGQKMTIGIG
jgi:biotin operon repressor